MQGLVQAPLRKTAMALLDSGGMEGKELLRGLQGLITDNILEPAGGAPSWAPGPPGSKWAIGIAVVLGVVLILTGFMLYYFRCGCTGPGEKDKTRPTV